MNFDKKYIIGKYTDNEYLTRSQLVEALGDEFTENYWILTHQYRKKYEHDIELKNTLNKNFSYKCIPNIIEKEINLHKEITQAGTNIYILNNLINEREHKNVFQDFINVRYCDELNALSEGNNFKINIDIVNDIITNKYQGNDVDHVFATELYKLLISFQMNTDFKNDNNITVDKLLDINRCFITDNENILRNKNIYSDNKYNITSNVSENLIGFDKKNLKVRLNDLIEFINNNSYNTFIKASILYFYIMYGKFFNKYNETTAILCFYYVISLEYPFIIPLLNVGKIVVSHYNKFTEKYKNSLSTNSDMTYFIHYLLTLLITNVKKTNNELKVIIKSLVEAPLQKSNISLSVQATNIVKTNANVSYKQAFFYVNHKMANIFYTINDFKTFIKCTYETARTGLTKLTQEDFYIKVDLTGKRKFLYKVNPNKNN